jgi:hypothetical protein
MLLQFEDIQNNRFYDKASYIYINRSHVDNLNADSVVIEEAKTKLQRQFSQH